MQRILILLFFVLILAACGQKGDLFLKDTDPQSNPLEKTANTAPSQDPNQPKPDQL